MVVNRYGAPFVMRLATDPPSVSGPESPEASPSQPASASRCEDADFDARR